jgi:hypothetical protein
MILEDEDEDESSQYEEFTDYTDKLEDLNYDQIQDKSIPSRPFYEIWNPETIKKSAWDILGFVFIVYQSIMVPFRISFDSVATGSVYIIEAVQDWYFISDILVNFNTGAYIGGQLCMRRKKVTIHYLKTWFLLDVLASFPYDMLMN